MITKEILDDYVARDLLYVQAHPHQSLLIYNYSQKVQYENLWDEVTLSCRGKIFDSSGLEVTRPLRKFFNIEEKRYKSTEDFEVFEKVDGSFISICKYAGELIVASRGSFTSDHVGWAKEILKEKRRQFKELGCVAKRIESLFAPKCTYCFELIWPDNRIVVDYGDKKDLVLLAVIDEFGNEYTYDELNLIYGKIFTIVPRFDGIKDFTKIQELNTHNAEGFVVRFSNGDRVKIKFADYCNLHRLVTDISTTRVYESLVAGTLDKWIEGIPDEFYQKIKQCANGYQKQYECINEYCQAMYGAIGHIQNRKKYAEHVLETDKKYHSILFAIKDSKDITKLIWKLIEPEYRKL